MLHLANVLPAWQSVSVENLSTGPRGNGASRSEDYLPPPSWRLGEEKTAKYKMIYFELEGLSKTDRADEDQDEDMKMNETPPSTHTHTTKEFTELIT